MRQYVEKSPLLEVAEKHQNNAFGAAVIKRAIEEAPVAEVAPKGEVAKEVLSDLKKAIRNRAVYSRYKDSDPYIRLKDVDEIVENYLKRKAGG